MKTILIVDEDKKFHRLVFDGLKAYGSVTARETKDIIVKYASNGKAAAKVSAIRIPSRPYFLNLLMKPQNWLQERAFETYLLPMAI